ncbi:MAG TPA: ATP-binding protein [Anaerolineae bacterium]|nr:ATP-binding protein [Anaerolineae bacterium]HQI84366.1 ATP-binding protein [Anaerolineae bacterium]
MKKLPHASSEDVLSTQNLVVTEVWAETERLRLLHSVLPWIGMALSVGMAIVLVVTLWHPQAWQLWAMFTVMTLSLGGYVQATQWGRRGRAIASSRLLISIVIVIGLALALLFEDLIVAFAILGLLISLLAGVLISPKVGYGFAVGLIVTAVGLVGLTLTSLYPRATLDLTSPTKQWVDLGIFLLTMFLGTYLVAISQEGTRLAFDRLVEQSNKLKVANKDLAHEIHERKQAEATLAQLNNTLETQVAERTAEVVAEKEKSDAILRSVGDAISVTGLDMRIQYVNDAFVALTGYSSAEIIGRPMYTLLVQECADTALRSQPLTWTTGAYTQREITMRRKDGRAYDAALTVAPLHDARGERTGYVFSHQDITKFKALDRARSQFITNVSHELRTPVTSIKLSTYLLQVERSPEKAATYLQALERQSLRLESLIQDILEMVSLDSGQGVTSWEPLFLASIIGEAATCYQRQADARNITLAVQPVPPDLPAVKGDPFRLEQALKEVLENALIFTPSGGAVTIATALTEAHGHPWVTLTVQDTGPGIAAEEKPKLFNRFFRGRLAESGHIPGTGLGLSIVYEIMRAHGGDVTVESEEGRGSVFTLWLPVS